MKIAILQSNYLPWTGVFKLINSVDKFVFYDNVQFTKQDWRTRNRIKTDNENLWLSVPIQRQKLKTNIVDIKICNEINWKKKHYKSFCQYYSKFVEELLEGISKFLWAMGLIWLHEHNKPPFSMGGGV